jgi:ketosteroid isomerase-like protein
MPIRLLPALLLSILGIACSAPRPRESLLAADAAHAKAVATDGLAEGFARYLADDAVYLEPDTDYIQGRDGVTRFLAARPAGTILRIHSARGDVSADGAVGYTIGWILLSTPGGQARYGKYLAFWRRQPDGGWKIEAWNRSRAAGGPPAPLPPLPRPAPRRDGLAVGDVAAEIRALLGVDSAFAAASVVQGAAAAFSSYAAPGAVSLGGAKDFVVGPEAIGREQAGPPDQVLDWRPALGGVGPLGDLGWTVGAFLFSPGGSPPRAFHGKYLTVWQHADSGSWRFVADGGSGSAPPSAPPDQR